MGKPSLEGSLGLKKIRQAVQQSAMVQFVLAFAAILALEWACLTHGPVWDTAMGLFPAAFTLAESGFDLLGLLGMPAYQAGGPNAHSTSSVTLLTAVVWMVSGGGTRAFVMLHLLHFGAAAAGLTALYRYARPVFSPGAGALLCVSVLLFPVFLVQVGYLYLEIPLFLCAVSALLAWVRGRFWPAALWAAVAFTVKQTGIIVSATLVAAVLLQRRRFRERVWMAARIAMLPVLWWAATMMLRSAATGDLEVVRSFEGHFSSLLHYVGRFLFNVPDLLLLVVFFLLVAPAGAAAAVRTLRREPLPPGERSRDQEGAVSVALSGVLVLAFLILFLVVLPVAADFTIVLPRYLVVIVPFLLLWLGFVVKRLLGGRRDLPASLVFALLAVFFALNHDGRFYPSDVDIEGPGNNHALAERSHAYLRLDGIQREAMAYLETLPQEALVYYGHYEHFLFSYPGLGYARKPLPNGHNLYIHPPTSVLDDPSAVTCLYVLYNYPWLGGAWAGRLVQMADSEERLSREVVQEFRDGRYVIYLIRIENADADCAVSRSESP